MARRELEKEFRKWQYFFSYVTLIISRSSCICRWARWIFMCLYAENGFGGGRGFSLLQLQPFPSPLQPLMIKKSEIELMSVTHNLIYVLSLVTLSVRLLSLFLSHFPLHFPMFLSLYACMTGGVVLMYVWFSEEIWKSLGLSITRRENGTETSSEALFDLSSQLVLTILVNYLTTAAYKLFSGSETVSMKSLLSKGLSFNKIFTW